MTSPRPIYAYGRKCGALVAGGKPCGFPIHTPQRVCARCRDAILEDYSHTDEGRAAALATYGAVELAATAGRIERERRQVEAEARRAAAEAARAHPGLVVYYARLGANHIKIGTTADLPRRMVELRVVNASNLLAAEPGGYDLERQRHQQFRKWRYSKRKEDFGEGDLLAHIKALRAQHGDPYTLAASLPAPTTTSPA
jgi:hypothetical protein